MITRKHFLELTGLVAIAAVDRFGLSQAAVLSGDIARDRRDRTKAIFDHGSAYPGAARVDLSDITVPVGATRVVVPVTIDRTTANTVVAFVRCLDGKGGRAKPTRMRPVIFRPGDPMTQTVAFDCQPLAVGQTLRLVQQNVPDGGKRGRAAATVIAATGAHLTEVARGRLPLPFVPGGTLAYDASGREVLEGGLWLDRYAHGRTQPGNSETGWALEDGKALALDGDDLLLRSWRLDEPARAGTPVVSYLFASAILTGLIINGRDWPKVQPELSFRFGTIEWTARMPNRRGSWPALWLCSVRNGYPQWPFEIDVFEGFYYNPQLKPGSSLTANLHGGKEGSSKREWTRPMLFSTMGDFGLPNTLDTAFHRFACRIDPNWITVWVDGTETMRWANPFAATEGWYPLMNVAVKADADDPYNDGSGDMAIRHVRIWRDE